MLARYATARLVELVVALFGCPAARTGHGGPAADFGNLGALVSNSPEHPTPSSSKSSCLTAIDLRLPIAGFRQQRSALSFSNSLDMSERQRLDCLDIAKARLPLRKR